MLDPYILGEEGTWIPPCPVAHRDDDYDSHGFESLRAMQTGHFWYRGRHRFIMHFTRGIVRHFQGRGQKPSAVDLGGGCGGWISYLAERAGNEFSELALADSSPIALAFARDLVPEGTRRYHVDLLNLQWSDRWDIAFLLDVLEHLEEDEVALRQIGRALRPGGYLVVATPAFERFRTSIDDMTHHVRRYQRRDFERLARVTGLALIECRYFMFFLSPLMWLARRKSPNPATMTRLQIRQHLERSAGTPVGPLNSALAAIFAAETPLGAWLPFPWGTSLLAVLQRPDANSSLVLE